MLQFPTNVFPQNNAVDVSKDVIRSFTFNGDRLAWVYDQTYDNDTGKKVLVSYAPLNGNGKPFKYNGETVEILSNSYTGVLENGKDYSHQMVLMQRDENGNNIYDIYIGRGRLLEDGNSSVMYIESSLNNIYEFQNEYYSANGMSFTGFKQPLYLPPDKILSFQWEQSKDSGATWNSISTANTYSTIATSSNNGYKYRCKVSDGTNTVISNAATLTIGASSTESSTATSESVSESGTLSIIEQPSSQTVPEKTIVYFSIKVSVDGVEYNLNDYLAAGIMIEINDKKYLVTDYHSFDENTNLGLLYTDATDKISLPAGTEYKLYSNYLVSPFYYFKCRTTPDVTVDMLGNNDGIMCTVTYSQLEGVSLKYYKLSLYEIVNDEEILVDETDRIYSYRLTYTFPENYAGKSYKVVCEVSTQDNMIVTTENTKTFSVATAEFLASINKPYFSPITNSVHITWEKASDCSVRLYRKDISTSDVVLIANTDATYFDDYTISNNKSYQYIVVPYYENEVGVNLISDTISIEYIGWTITAITNTNEIVDNKPVYSIGDTWKVIGDIDNVTVTQNTDKTLHVNTAKYPVLSEGDTNYMSSTLTAMVGYIDCDNKTWVDNIDIVNAWRKFITQHCQFILKSQKGDVWAVNITESPTTEYDESYYAVLTKFSFSWAEFANINDLLCKK